MTADYAEGGITRWHLLSGVVGVVGMAAFAHLFLTAWETGQAGFWTQVAGFIGAALALQFMIVMLVVSEDMQHG